MTIKAVLGAIKPGAAWDNQVQGQMVQLHFNNAKEHSMDTTGTATWIGSWKEGGGYLSTGGDTISNAPYSYLSRFKGASGASPEELLAVAEASCFNQALANNFGMNALIATHISTTVAVTIQQDEKSRPTITGMHVTTEASAPEATEEVFQKCAERARTNCTIARLLKIDITMSATLII